MQKGHPPGWPSEDKDERLAGNSSSFTSEGLRFQSLLAQAGIGSGIEELAALLPELVLLQCQCRAKLERLLARYDIKDILETTQSDLIGLALVAGGRAFIGPLAPLGQPLTIASVVEELMDAFPGRHAFGALLIGDFVLAKHFMLYAKRAWPEAVTLPAHAAAEHIGDWAGRPLAVDALLAALHALTLEPRERWRATINSVGGRHVPVRFNPYPVVPMIRVLLPPMVQQ